MEISPVLCDNRAVSLNVSSFFRKDRKMNKTNFRRWAFTLVELLVVIVIIGMLAGLLLPAIGAAREAARRAQCLDRMRQVGIAFQSYNNANNGLPGYVNRLRQYHTGAEDVDGNSIAGGDKVLSWAAAILPELGEQKRYDFLYKDVTDKDELKLAIEELALPVLICPSAQKIPERYYPALSFVVNCGPAEYNDNGDQLVGSTVAKYCLFADRRFSSINKKVKLEEIKDGTSNTILMTENLQAFTWYNPRYATWDDPSQSPSDPNNIMNQTTSTTAKIRNSVQIASFGFLWNNVTNISTTPSDAEPIVRINARRTDGMPTSWPPHTGYARPSSNHPGLVNMLYADTTVRPMSDDVGLGPYLSAVCPDDAAAAFPTTAGGLGYTRDQFKQESW